MENIYTQKDKESNVEDFVKQIRPSLVHDDVIFTDTLEQNDKLKFLVIAR